MGKFCTWSVVDELAWSASRCTGHRESRDGPIWTRALARTRVGFTAYHSACTPNIVTSYYHGFHSEQFVSSDSSSENCIVLAVADASGRYVPSFFWGNSYWTGSESLCYQLNSNASRLEAPPFRLGFYTVRLQIALPQYISPSVSITAEQRANERTPWS
jgi:hypothetical protein